MRKAVIDVGSNSVLLLVAQRLNDDWLPVLETSRVTGLGAETKKTGVLGEAGMTSTLAALKDAFTDAQEAGAESVDAAATMAARIAKNARQFLDRAELQGTPVTILSGEREADLGFRSVADDPAFAAHRKLSIVDVGGHSTEIVTAEREGGDWAVRFRRSYPIGTLALRSGALAAENPDSMARIHAVAEIDDTFGLAYRPGEAGHAVALGATATNLVTIREAMTEWDSALVHGVHLDYEEVGRSVGWLSAMTDAERAQIVGIERGREHTLHIGVLILERALFALRVEGCSVSVRGWRHALLAESD